MSTRRTPDTGFADTRLAGVPVPFHRRFEEVNLRFHVRRETGGETRRGVVFVKEIVPRRAVPWHGSRACSTTTAPRSPCTGR
jgi:hypothetical protein